MDAPVEGSDDRAAGWWRDIRRDPAHAAEIAVRHAQPKLAPHVEHWWRKTQRTRASEPPERIARRVLRRSTQVARRGGLVTGSSLYVAMVPTLVMIYCEQVVLVLRIAAAFGREPSDPIRAAEFLFLQGRYPTVEAAALALQQVENPVRRARPPIGARSLTRIVRQVPSMIGLGVGRFRARSVFDKAIGVVEVVSYFVPVVSLPIWAIANARATRRLGRAALDFYRRLPEDTPALPELRLAPRPRRRTRKLIIGTVVPLALAMGVVVALLPLGRYQHGLRWATLAIGESVLVLTFARLIRLTRMAGPATAPG